MDLRVRRVECDTGVGIERVLLHIRDDADDGQPGVIIVGASLLQPLANGICIGPIGARHILVNDSDLGRISSILFIEETPSDQWNSHGLEIADAGDALVSLDSALSRRRVITFNCDAAPTDTPAERQNRNSAP